MDEEHLDKQWPLLMGVRRRDVAYCIATGRDPEGEYDDVYDVPDWAETEAEALTDEQMEYICKKVSEYFWDEEKFYWVVGFVCDDLIHKRSN